MSTPADGTIYVVSVSGDKFADQALRDYAEVGFADTSTYQTIEIDDIENRLTYRSLERLGRSRRPPRDLQASATGTGLSSSRSRAERPPRPAMRAPRRALDRAT